MLMSILTPDATTPHPIGCRSMTWLTNKRGEGEDRACQEKSQGHACSAHDVCNPPPPPLQSRTDSDFQTGHKGEVIIGESGGGVIDAPFGGGGYLRDMAE